MRLVFLGSPAFAVPSIDAVLAAGHEVGLVVTQPDRPAGRGQKRTPPPAALYAAEHGLPVWQTSSLRGAEAEGRLRAVRAEGMVLAAFAALVPGNVLGLTSGGILNVHPSLLPRWRGAAPIQAALLAGDTQTGVSIIRLVAALDAGPILLQERVAIAESDDYQSLEPRLARLGAQLVVRALAERPAPQPQDDAAATYCKRIEREDARIDWSLPAEHIRNQVRAYRGWPQAFTTFDGRQLKVLRARAIAAGQAGSSPAPGTVVLRDGAPVVITGAGWLHLDEVQLEGKRAQYGAEFLRGYPRLLGAVLGGAVA
ncbi:MAG: methionyl-tRNA formyltransferase [Chloroflexi bacterium]|nr:methionyl-tRNA formyltransferase [Chloroflexota bacterium]